MLLSELLTVFHQKILQTLSRTQLYNLYDQRASAQALLSLGFQLKQIFYILPSMLFQGALSCVSDVVPTTWPAEAMLAPASD